MLYEEWFYSDRGEQRGPVTLSDLQRMISSGRITASTFVWNKKLDEWEPAHRHVPNIAPPPPDAGLARNEIYFERVGPLEAMKRFFEGYFDFSGRSNRGEYWWSFLIIYVSGLLLSFMPVLALIFTIATLLPSIAVSVRRLHDTDRSGWWLLAPLIPFMLGLVVLFATMSEYTGPSPVSLILMAGGLIMGIVLYVWYCFKGTDGPNRFG